MVDVRPAHSPHLGGIRTEREAYAAAGVDYVVAAPWQTDIDSWLHSMEQLADLVDLTPRS